LLRRIKKIIVFGFILLSFGLQPTSAQPGNKIRDLLDETGAECKIINSAGGFFSREMYCEISVSKAELNKLIENLGLSEGLPYFEGEKRIIIVADGTNPCSAALRKKYKKAFGIQQWIPTRHGFASVILFYNNKTERGCLYLSIAYG